jgi:hypothetical protein
MRIPYSTLAGCLGALAGLVATAAIAGSAHPKPAKTTCHCAVSAVGAAHHHHARAHVWRHVAVRRHGGFMGHHMWGGQRGWSEESGWGGSRGWHEEHGWREAEGGAAGAWMMRPWATDPFGFLTWPGKSHFAGGHYVQDGPPPPPEMGPPPPPPGDAGPPPPPGPQSNSYEIYRF